MARLLLWVPDRGCRGDDAHWRRLCGRLVAGLPNVRPEDRFEWRGGGCSALAIRTRAADPVPLHVHPDGRLVLADIRDPIAPGVPEWPSDDPGAIIVLDPASGAIRLLRDRLGQRPLAYARLRDGWLIASREAVMLAHPDVDRSFDDAFLATHLALVDPLPGASLFRGIRLVEHGTRVDLHGSAVQVQRMSWEPEDGLGRWTDARAAREFMERLEASVVACCRGASRLGMQLSAGLDSSSVAVLLPAAFRQERTLAVNYGTRIDGGVDERPLAQTLARRLGISFESMNTADYPASLEAGADRDPSYPYLNPYRPLKRAVHDRFARAGCDVVLTGDFGDHWEAPSRTWLADALSNRRYDVAFDGLLWAVRRGGVRGFFADAGIRHVLRRWAGRVDRPADHGWLQPEWQDLVRGQMQSGHERFGHWPLPAHAAYNFGTLNALDAAFERHYIEPRGFDLRHPWRNWPLLRFALSLPAYQSWRAGTGKWLARQAIADVLPAEWSTRPKLGDLRPLLDRLVEPGPRRTGFVDLIEAGRPTWERFVRRSVVADRLAVLDAEGLGDGLLLELASFSSWVIETKSSEAAAHGYCGDGSQAVTVAGVSGEVT